jgi:hypothetical protein
MEKNTVIHEKDGAGMALGTVRPEQDRGIDSNGF